MLKVTLMVLCLCYSLWSSAFAQSLMCGKINYLKVNSQELELRFHDIETTYFADSKFASSILPIFSTSINKDTAVCVEDLGKLTRDNRQSFKTVTIGDKFPFPLPVDESDNNKPDIASTAVITN